MAKGVAFTDQAKADLRAIQQPIALQILRTWARFLESEEGNVKRLEGVEPPLCRLHPTAFCSATSATTSKSPASAIARNAYRWAAKQANTHAISFFSEHQCVKS